MTSDQSLLKINIPATISEKLEDLAIRSVRQLYVRLREDKSRLQNYLQSSDEEFTNLYNTIENIIKDEYPEDIRPTIHPVVNKTGVAAYRLHDPARPKYKKRTQA